MPGVGAQVGPEEFVDVRAVEATVTARPDAVGREQVRVGPVTYRVGVHVEQPGHLCRRQQPCFGELPLRFRFRIFTYPE